MPRNYAGKTLRGRPFKPEDDLKGAKFTGATLRGVNFKGLDLTDADFTNADICSANFTNAILKNTSFTDAKAGLQKHWAIAQFVVILLLSTVLNFSSILICAVFAASFMTPDSINKYTIYPGIAVVLVVAATCFAIAQQGLTSKAIGTTVIAVAFAVVVAFACAFAGAVAVMGIVTVAFACTFAVTVAVVVVGVVGGVGPFAFAVTVIVAAAVVVVCVVAFAGVFAGAVAGTVAMGVAMGVAVAVFSLSLYVAWRTYKGDEKFALARSLGIAIGAIGGTSFCGADLTAATFTGAKLKCTNFNSSRKTQTILTHTCWSKAKQLDRARTSNSMLSDATIRDLLVTGNGYQKTYIGANLYGANLNGANLEGANLKRANLSHAKLQQAHLKDANLAKILATGADFTDAYLTGACLEAWNIDHTSILENIDCQFVFLLQEPNTLGSRERRPHDPSKVFKKGDFEKLYRKIMTTVQILLRDGINPEAFATAFQKLMTEHPEITPDSIQSIEKKDSDVLLTLQVPATADKAKIEQQFDDAYQTRLEAQKNAALLAAEERHNKDLKELALKQAENFDISQLLSNLTIIAGDRNTMTDNKNQGITTRDGSFINTGTLSNSLVNLSGTVSTALNRLAENDPSQAELKSLLAQLQTAIETAPDLPDPDKTDALEQVGVLATLGSNPQQPEKEGLGRKAITFLKGTIAMLPSTATLVKAISELLPAITKLMGL
jgi:uncharacterized protein YjbI with pentapeptide repeats